MSGSRWIIIESDLNTYRPITLKSISASGTPLLAMEGPKIAQKWPKIRCFPHCDYIINNKLLDQGGSSLDLTSTHIELSQ